MNFNFAISHSVILSILLLPLLGNANEVLPTIGGGQVTMMDGAPMKHIGIHFDGNGIQAHLDTTVANPILRPLSPPNTFNEAEPWSVLGTKHHNFQHGWIPEGIWSPPADAAVWIEHLDSTPELQVYEGGRFMSESTIREMTFEPLFGTNGSSPIWKWGGMMTHNAYAVVDPTLPEYSATYRVYLGDEATGAELTNAAGEPLYSADQVTLTFATSVPEPSGGWLCLATALPIATSMRRRRNSR